MAVLSDLATCELEILQLLLGGKTNRAFANDFLLAQKPWSFTWRKSIPRLEYARA